MKSYPNIYKNNSNSINHKTKTVDLHSLFSLSLEIAFAEKKLDHAKIKNGNCGGIEKSQCYAIENRKT